MVSRWIGVEVSEVGDFEEAEGGEERDVKPLGTPRADARREKVIRPVERERCSSWRPMV